MDFFSRLKATKEIGYFGWLGPKEGTQFCPLSEFTAERIVACIEPGPCPPVVALRWPEHAASPVLDRPPRLPHVFGAPEKAVARFPIPFPAALRFAVQRGVDLSGVDFFIHGSILDQLCAPSGAEQPRIKAIRVRNLIILEKDKGRGFVEQGVPFQVKELLTGPATGRKIYHMRMAKLLDEQEDGASVQLLLGGEIDAIDKIDKDSLEGGKPLKVRAGDISAKRLELFFQLLSCGADYLVHAQPKPQKQPPRRGQERRGHAATRARPECRRQAAGVRRGDEHLGQKVTKIDVFSAENLFCDRVAAGRICTAEARNDGCARAHARTLEMHLTKVLRQIREKLPPMGMFAVKIASGPSVELKEEPLQTQLLSEVINEVIDWPVRAPGLGPSGSAAPRAQSIQQKPHQLDALAEPRAIQPKPQTTQPTQEERPPAPLAPSSVSSLGIPGDDATLSQICGLKAHVEALRKQDLSRNPIYETLLRQVDKRNENEAREARNTSNSDLRSYSRWHSDLLESYPKLAGLLPEWDREHQDFASIIRFLRNSGTHMNELPAKIEAMGVDVLGKFEAVDEMENETKCEEGEEEGAGNGEGNESENSIQGAAKRRPDDNSAQRKSDGDSNEYREERHAYREERVEDEGASGGNSIKNGGNRGRDTRRVSFGTEISSGSRCEDVAASGVTESHKPNGGGAESREFEETENYGEDNSDAQAKITAVDDPERETEKYKETSTWASYNGWCQWADWDVASGDWRKERDGKELLRQKQELKQGLISLEYLASSVGLDLSQMRYRTHAFCAALLLLSLKLWPNLERDAARIRREGSAWAKLADGRAVPALSIHAGGKSKLHDLILQETVGTNRVKDCRELKSVRPEIKKFLLKHEGILGPKSGNCFSERHEERLAAGAGEPGISSETFLLCMWGDEDSKSIIDYLEEELLRLYVQDVQARAKQDAATQGNGDREKNGQNGRCGKSEKNGFPCEKNGKCEKNGSQGKKNGHSEKEENMPTLDEEVIVTDTVSVVRGLYLWLGKGVLDISGMNGKWASQQQFLSRRESLLHKAVQRGNLPEAETAFRAGVLLTWKDRDGKTAGDRARERLEFLEEGQEKLEEKLEKERFHSAGKRGGCESCDERGSYDQYGQNGERTVKEKLFVAKAMCDILGEHAEKGVLTLESEKARALLNMTQISR